MKNVFLLSVVALTLIGCGKKEDAAVVPAGCAANEVESVNDAGEHVCVAAPAEAAVEAPAAEAAVVEAAPAAEAAPAVEAPAAQ